MFKAELVNFNRRENIEEMFRSGQEIEAACSNEQRFKLFDDHQMAQRAFNEILCATIATSVDAIPVAFLPVRIFTEQFFPTVRNFASAITGKYGYLQYDENPSEATLAAMHVPVNFKPDPIKGEVLGMGGFLTGRGWGDKS